ncbi:phosphatase PAP2 family protein [Halovenus rubra]|uniref:Phosphatase PAP2 family protein n=2 Tax=Halovenus rubra TaxID=869890 RepID=A0ACC7DYR3_9EURY|nr:phosphatase PAP2 family protein [Halovenus rubra]
MTLLIQYLQLVTVVTVCLGVGLYTIVGPARIRSFYVDYRTRLCHGLAHLSVLGTVFGISMYWRPIGGEVSWTLEYNITHTLYSIEGYLVPTIQELATTKLTWALSLVYVFGYVFLVLFPLVSYLFLDTLRPFRVTALSYIINYLIGLGSYTLFIAYGPRNYMPGEVRGLMYEVWPEIEALTTHINTNTNVFPSLHTSLAVTVALLAWYTRDSYPRWFYLASALAGTIAFSTMYLGLHWGTDVVTGAALGITSVWAASYLAAESDEQSRITTTGQQLFATAGDYIKQYRP